MVVNDTEMISELLSLLGEDHYIALAEISKCCDGEKTDFKCKMCHAFQLSLGLCLLMTCSMNVNFILDTDYEIM